MSFAAWNARIADHFFGEFAKGQQVRLSISREVLDDEFADLGGEPGFLIAVRKGPDWPVGKQKGLWIKPTDFVQRARGLHAQWQFIVDRVPTYKSIRDDGPPYFPYLCVLCYAWTLEVDGLAGHNFYGRLNEIYPNHGLEGQLHRLDELWSGLAQWTNSLHGSIGSFVVESLGEMPYVGIPKSQVILTPKRAFRLPLLFSSLGLESKRHLPEAELRQYLIDGINIVRDLLGNEIATAIQNDSQLGTAAVRQLLQHFDEWEPSDFDAVVSESHSSNDPNNREPAKGRFLLSLRNSFEDSRWQPQVHVGLHNASSGKISFERDGRQWVLQLRDSVGGPATEDGASTTAALDGLWLTDQATYDYRGSWSDELTGDQIVSLRYVFRPLRVLRWQVDATLVEEPLLPTAGDAYVLVHNSVETNWQSWVDGLPAQVETTAQIPQDGLPPNWRLYYLTGLESIEDEHWSRFPDGGPSNRRRPATVRLVGGSRARRTGISRPYLIYHPPKLVVESEGNVSLNVIGATIEEQKGQVGQAPWAHNVSSRRVFSIYPDDRSSRITITVSRDGVPIGQAAFNIVRNLSEIEAAPIGQFRVDEFGSPARIDVHGVYGAVAPPVDEQWTYSDGLAFDWRLGEISIPDDARLQFLEWLAVRGRVPFSHARDQAELMTGKAIPAAAFRVLAALAHLDIQTDNRGRWAYIHAAPPCIYTLPAMSTGQYQAVVSGATTRSIVQQVLDAATNASVDIDVAPQIGCASDVSPLIPYRLCLRSSDFDALATIARNCGLTLDPVPPAHRITKLSGSCASWHTKLNWYPEAGPAADSTYYPWIFRFVDNGSWPAKCNQRFGRFIDPVTEQHYSFKLATRNGDLLQHAFVTQKEWGCWSTYRSALDAYGLNDIPIPIAFDSRSQSIIVPLTLDLPYLLSRALVLCSGLAPRVFAANEFPAYTNPQYGFVAGGGYGGHCIAYKFVPRIVADAVLSRVGAVCLEPPVAVSI